MEYLSRVLEAKVQEYLEFFSTVGVTGPRQSGKSTLLLHLLKKDYTYVSFDDMRLVQFYYDDPVKFMAIYKNKVIFDEVQKVPEIFHDIKMAVDKDRDNPGKFILTGSSQFSFHRNISESLAGRIGLLSLLPYQYSELSPDKRQQSMYQGSYPELVGKGYQLANDWYSAYLDTYIANDVRTLSNIGDLLEFRRFIQLLAAQVAQLLNLSEFARELGVDVKTVKRWLSILEASYIVFLLPPYYQNFGKRVIKSPKVYFYDAGLVASLLGIETEEQFEKSPIRGHLFENYVVAEILKKKAHTKASYDLYFFRDSHGNEVDLIIDHKQYREWIEIKSGYTFRPKLVKPIESLMTGNDKGYLLYRGDKFPYTSDLQVINYGEFLLREA